MYVAYCKLDFWRQNAYVEKYDKEIEARNVLQKLRGKQYDISKEIEEMIERKKSLDKQHELESKVTLKIRIGKVWSTIKSPRFLKPFSFVGIASLIGPMCGVWPLFMYMVMSLVHTIQYLTFRLIKQLFVRR